MSDRTIRIITLSVIGAVVAVLLFFITNFTVDQSERAIVTRNGAIIGVAEPGMHFLIPILDSATSLSLQEQSTVYANVETYSRDQQLASILISVNWRINPDMLVEIYTTFGSFNNLITRIVDRRVPDTMKSVFGQYTAITAIQNRAQLRADISEAVMAALAETGVIIPVSVQVEDIAFSETYEGAVEQRMLAEVAVERLRQQAEQERINAEITVIQAEAAAEAAIEQATGAAERTRLQAIADAEATRIQGDAEAAAIAARGEALLAYPGLVALIAAERWNGVLPQQMVPNAALPFINLTPTE